MDATHSTMKSLRQVPAALAEPSGCDRESRRSQSRSVPRLWYGKLGIRLLGPGLPVRKLSAVALRLLSDHKGGNRQVDGDPAVNGHLPLPRVK